MLATALVFLAVGFGLYPFVHGALAGVSRGDRDGDRQWLLLAGAVDVARRPHATGPAAHHVPQRVVMNLGIGIGALVGGLIASTSHPTSFTVLFAMDAVTLLVYLAILFAFVPSPDLGQPADDAPAGRYVNVLGTARSCA